MKKEPKQKSYRRGNTAKSNTPVGRPKFVRRDLTGRKFGKLLIIECIGISASRSTIWRGKCDCGNEALP